MLQSISHNQTVSYSTPIDILKEKNALNKVNRYTLLTPELEVKSTEVDFKLFTVEKSHLWSVAKKVVVIASLSIAIGAVFSVALYASTFTFPVIFGIGLLYYKLHPIILQPIETNYFKALLKRTNLDGIIQKEKTLKEAPRAELRAKFLKLGIDTKNYCIDKKKSSLLTEDQALTLLVPLLARFEFWKEQIEATEKVQNQLTTRIEEIRDRIRSDDNYELSPEEALELEEMIDNSYTKIKALIDDNKEENQDEITSLREEVIELEKQRKLSEEDKIELIKEIVSLTYKIEDLDEDDALEFQLNSRILSAIKASYLLDIMHDLTQKKMIGEFGEFNSHLKHVREALQGTSTGDDYFLAKEGDNISFQDFKNHVRDFEFIRRRMFHPEADLTKEESA